MLEEKTLLDYTNFFSIINYTIKNDKVIICNLKTNITKENVSLDFRLKKIWWDRKSSFRRNKTS